MAGRAEQYIKDGDNFYNVGRYTEAIVSYDKALAINPDYDLVWSSKGGILGELGRFEEAIDCCDKALEINPRSIQALNNKRISIENLGTLQDSIKCCDTVINATTPKNARLTHRFCDWEREESDAAVIERVTPSQPLVPNYQLHTDSLPVASQTLNTLSSYLKTHRSESSALSRNSSIRSPRPVNITENILKPKYTKLHGATSRKKYIFPILEYLVNNKGTITNDAAYQIIELKCGNMFNQIDHQLLRDGFTHRWQKNVDWAKSHMKASGMLTQATRCEWKITKYGEECHTKLKENPLIQIEISGGIISFQNS